MMDMGAMLATVILVAVIAVLVLPSLGMKRTCREADLLIEHALRHAAAERARREQREPR